MNSFGKCALLIAHPGHEIRVHGWLEKTKPVVYVLTDGSGRSAPSRLASTTCILVRAGARPGDIYGRLPDRALYDAVLRQDLRFFRQLAAELADEIVRERFDFVLGDAAEGEILTHDLWRGVIDAALANAQQRLNTPIASYQFLLEGPPNQRSVPFLPQSMQLLLNDAELARKLEAARSYPELKAAVEEALAAYGEDAFRMEYLEPANGQTASRQQVIPRYEHHGESLVATGIYSEAVRYARHVAPILTELRRSQGVS
jgi:hypothetical protein